MTPQEMVANAMLEQNQQANRLGIPQQMGAFANSLGMVPSPEQEALADPLIGPETYGLGNMGKMAAKAAPIMIPGALGMISSHSPILYQNGPFTVRKAKKGYEVYQDDGVAAKRVATLGSEGQEWLTRAMQEADKRAGAK
jgi:hypothetical protein